MRHASGGGSVVLSSPGISLEPKPSLAIGVVFHELATKAGKYGALSANEVRIANSCELVDAGETAPKF